MVESFANKLDSLGLWRGQLNRTLQELSRFLHDHDLLDAAVHELLEALAASRILAFESALDSELLPRRQDMLQHLVLEGLGQLESQVGRHLADQQRQLTEQLVELRGLHGKSSGTVGPVLQRVQSESAEFEQCVRRVRGLRTVHSSMLQPILLGLSSAAACQQVDMLHRHLRSALLPLGAKKSFSSMCARLRERLSVARLEMEEASGMLSTSFARLEAEFGLGLTVPAAPDLQQFTVELELIERNYIRYLGLTQVLRLSPARFVEQFCRMLLSKVAAVFDAATHEVETWNHAVASQIDAQLRERRRSFRRRHETLERVQQARAELERRIAELESQHERLRQQQQGLAALLQRLRQQAQILPAPAPHDALALRKLQTAEPA